MSTNPATITANWTALYTLAPDRFDAYRRPQDVDELDPISRYAWNIDVSKALHPKLHVLEIAFRNQLHNSLTALYGATWYDNPGLLRPRQRDEVSSSKDKLTSASKPHSPGRVIAGLSFGFWTALYSPRYDFSIGRRTVQSVFPHYSGSAHLERSLIAPMLNDIRKLRNRVSHFEHIAFDPQLPRYHREISDLIAWMNPQMADLSDIGDNLLLVYGKTWKAYRPVVEQLFG
jgi:hypothetical protein